MESSIIWRILDHPQIPSLFSMTPPPPPTPSMEWMLVIIQLHIVETWMEMGTWILWWENMMEFSIIISNLAWEISFLLKENVLVNSQTLPPLHPHSFPHSLHHSIQLILPQFHPLFFPHSTPLLLPHSPQQLPPQHVKLDGMRSTPSAIPSSPFPPLGQKPTNHAMPLGHPGLSPSPTKRRCPTWSPGSRTMTSRMMCGSDSSRWGESSLGREDCWRG